MRHLNDKADHGNKKIVEKAMRVMEVSIIFAEEIEYFENRCTMPQTWALKGSSITIFYKIYDWFLV